MWTRPKLTDDDALKALESAKEDLFRGLKKHGHGATVSSHEAFGDISEESKELLDAIHANDITEVRAELLNVATAAIWAVASIDAGVLEI